MHFSAPPPRPCVSAVKLTPLQLKDRQLRRHSDPPWITNEPKATVDIQILISFLVKVTPLLVNILNRTPLDRTDLHPKLESMGMSCKHHINIGVGGPYLGIPVRRVVRT